MVFPKSFKKSRRKRSLKSRVVHGIWVGIYPRTGDHKVILLSGGPAIRVRTIIRRPDSEKWNATEILNIVATRRRPNPRNTDQREPNSMRETKGFDIGGDGFKLSETPVQDPENIKPLEFRITREMI